MKSKFDSSILKTILETTPSPYVLKDKNSIYIYANKAFSDFLGKDIEDIIGKTDYDLFPEEEAEKYIIGDKAVMSGREQQQEEWKVQGGTDVKWLQVLKTPVLDKENIVVGLLCSVTDVSKLKQSEEMLQESEENFRALIETIEDIVLVGNPDGSIIYSNPAASSKLGYDQKELCKLKIIDLHPPSLRKEAAFIVSEMISGKQDVCPLPVLGKNGNLISVETRVWLGKWNGTDCIFGISKDLSKEQEALQKFDRIFRMNPALMAVSKMSDRTFTDVNDAFLQTLGYSKEEIIGKSTLELNLFVNKEEQNQVAQMLSDDGHFREIEMQVRTKQGGIRYGLFSGDTIETQGTNYFLTVMVDITERKQAEAERKLIGEALVHQKQRLSYILEGTNVGTWEWDVQTGETIFNERWANIIGYTLEEISPVSIDTWMKFAHPDDLKISGEILEKNFTKELDYYEFEARMQHKNGNWVWVLDRGQVVSWTDEGKPLLMCGTHQDITDRKESEKDRERLIIELKESLVQVKTLSGLLPICSNCKKIRNDEGYWKQIEGYIQQHTDAKFSHGICPECSDELYGKEDWYIEIKNEKKKKE